MEQNSLHEKLLTLTFQAYKNVYNVRLKKANKNIPSSVLILVLYIMLGYIANFDDVDI